jgi:arsenate reductase-like glutaredoxin family protein
MNFTYVAVKSSLFGSALLLFLAAPTFSQRPPGPPPVDRRTNPERLRQQEMSKREWQLRNFGNQPGKPPDRRRLEALMAQTEEDFNRILILHNEIARALSSNKDLDHQFVSSASAEIRKRASSLQNNLALREPTKEQTKSKPEHAINDGELKTSLVNLCRYIKNFVTNPVIETPSTINVEQLTKARLDLESLIQLSGQIEKDADELGKTRKP